MQIPGLAASTHPRHHQVLFLCQGQGSARGSFGGCRLPSVLPLRSPPAMHYQGRAEDGSRNLVSLPVFCLLGKRSAGLLQMGLWYGFNDIVPGVTAGKETFLLVHLTLFHAEKTLKKPRNLHVGHELRWLPSAGILHLLWGHRLWPQTHELPARLCPHSDWLSMLCLMDFRNGQHVGLHCIARKRKKASRQICICMLDALHTHRADGRGAGSRWLERGHCQSYWGLGLCLLYQGGIMA